MDLKTVKDNTLTTTDEELFAQKAANYLLCINDTCERKDHCLCHILMSYVPQKTRIIRCLNPKHMAANGEGCENYKSNEKVQTPKGMVHFFDDIPGKIGKEIRSSLISSFGESTFYRFRNGERLITTDILEQITTVCSACGWKEPLVFDENVMEYLW